MQTRVGRCRRAGYLTLGAGGLAMNGGNGIDGETLLAWLDPIEMGGTLLLEAVGVTLAPGSTGILAGFFQRLLDGSGLHRGISGDGAAGTGAVTLQPIVQGTPAGTHICNEPSQPIYACASACIARRVIARALSITRLEISGAITAGGGWTDGSGQDADGDSGVCERRGRNAGDAL